MNITIRNAAASDMDRIMEIYAAAKRFMEEHGNTQQWTGDDTVKRDRLDVMREKKQLFVGTDDNDIHFVFAYIQGDDPTYSVIDNGAWLNEEPYSTIHRLASAGTVKGVVHQISVWALEQNPNLRIDTHADNIVMQNALLKDGFTRCGIIYLENGDPRTAFQKTK